MALLATESAPSTSPQGQPLVRVGGLSKTFRRRGGEVRVLREIDLEVAEGEFLVLLGPSGCGKTTLLRCLVGLERPDAGRIDLGRTCMVDAERGVFAPPNHRDVGMVFQNYALWPHMPVRKNVAYPLRSRKQGAALREGRIEEVLDIVQCGHLADRYPPELSGGQQQRVSLARALAPRPALLLLDEPLSNLDALLRLELRAQLRVLHRKLGFTAVHVTHDQEEALALGTRVAVMKEGQVEQIGDPVEVYRAPATEYVADFLGARNRIEMRVDSSAARIAGRTVDGVVRAGLTGAFVLRMRDEHLAVRSAGGPGAPRTAWLSGGRVIELLPGVETSTCVVELDEQMFYARLDTGLVDVRPGDQVDIGIVVDKTTCYDEDGDLVREWCATETAEGGR
ncbi:ABC transporter ATP-binding protein [Streptomyces sp. NBC_01795]|uniref:ABC transporter ATP-binding protein n=1 Tax=unclassified Streptomyces TaxID=2593676 RepID=UPI002DDC86E0|nr:MULTISPECIES: ABC transporter ATP-binding protein [unclassified Streptomyces]WSA90629.1 ABC transporter ATP-binding protein [Streptomyces sp. NBC_01795]WSS16763.1 ABC transporter ATP-binding protein [Streptomyces sp. NBC_01186]